MRRAAGKTARAGDKAGKYRGYKVSLGIRQNGPEKSSFLSVNKATASGRGSLLVSLTISIANASIEGLGEFHEKNH
jgi:hypothetical protein